MTARMRLAAVTAALLVMCLHGDVSAGTVSPSHAKFLKDYYARYNAAGAARLGDFYADDAAFTDPSFELDLKGRTQIGDLLTRALAKYETLDHEIINAISAGDELVVEGLMVATLRGKPLRVRFVTVFRFAGGKIAAQHDLYDLRHYFQQLGVSGRP